MTTVTLEDIKQARTAMLNADKQEDGMPPIRHTPCLRAPWLEQLALEAWGTERQDGFEVRLKLETWQETASFKQRGAFNKLRCLRERYGNDTKIRVFAASAGNHAQGVARHARDFNIHATIVMPTKTPQVKVDNTKRLLEKPLDGWETAGEVIQVGENYDEAKRYTQCALYKARKRFKDSAKVKMVHAFNDPAVIAGQGTLGLELLDNCPDIEGDWPEVEVVVAGVGGGGLISGLAVAMKEHAAANNNPAAMVLGVESAAEPAAYLDREWGTGLPLNIEDWKLKLGTIADGISVAKVGKYTKKFLRDRRYVDELLTVQESEIARAIVKVLRKGKLLVEGACATTVAALLNPDNKKIFAGKRVVLVLSGGNLDPGRLAEIIHWYEVEPTTGDPSNLAPEIPASDIARVIDWREFSNFVKRTYQDPDKAWKEANSRMGLIP